jgi:hypothetical protein
MRSDAGRFAEIVPLGPLRDLCFVIAEIQQTAAAEARVLAGVGGKLLPEFECPGGQGQFPCIPVQLAAPAPVAARLLGGDAALFNHGH